MNRDGREVSNHGLTPFLWPRFPGRSVRGQAEISSWARQGSGVGTRRADYIGVAALNIRSGLQSEGGIRPTQFDLVADDLMVELDWRQGCDRILDGDEVV